MFSQKFCLMCQMEFGNTDNHKSTYQNTKPVKREVYFEPPQDLRNNFHTKLQFHSVAYKKKNDRVIPL